MANARVVIGRRSRQPGTTLGVQVNTFGMDKLIESGVTGEDLAEIGVEALQPAFEQAKSDWPVLTGASIRSMEVVVVEVGAFKARVSLNVGGPALMADPDNPKGIDYAPFIEFNGSPTGRGKGAIRNAVYGNDRQIREDIHRRVRELIARKIA